MLSMAGIALRYGVSTYFDGSVSVIEVVYSSAYVRFGIHGPAFVDIIDPSEFFMGTNSIYPPGLFVSDFRVTLLYHFAVLFK